MIERESPVTEEELHAYVDGQLAADRLAAVEQWLAEHADDAARVGRGAHRPTRCTRAMARWPMSRCHRVSTLEAGARKPQMAAACRRCHVARLPCRRRRRLARTGRVGRRGPDARGDHRGVRGTSALHRRSAPSDRGESRREPSQPLALAPRRLRDADAQSRCVRTEAARRPAAAGKRRSACCTLYV